MEKKKKLKPRQSPVGHPWSSQRSKGTSGSELTVSLPLTSSKRQDASYDTKRSPKLTIDDLPDELLVEIFDLYRRANVGLSDYQLWSIKLEWFNLIHVCKRWRTVMFESSSRLDLYFLLKPRMRGNLNTIMSRHSPPLPIDIDYEYSPVQVLKPKDMGRMVAALKRPDRIRRIALSGKDEHLAKLFKATKCPFPALESLELELRIGFMVIPATFLKGSNLHLRTLKLRHIFLPSIERLLSSAPALSSLSLEYYSNVGPEPAMTQLLSYLQVVPCLRHLGLEISCSINPLPQPTESQKSFALPKLTSLRYRGRSAFLNTLMAGFEAPSLREVDISLYDLTLPPISHLTRLIEDVVWENYHAFKVILERDYFRFGLLSRSDDINDHSPRFRLLLFRFPDFAESMMQLSRAFSAKFSAIQELIVISRHTTDAWEDVIPWHRFLLPFSSVKSVMFDGTNYLRIANTLLRDQGGSNLAFLPVLEKIEVCKYSSYSARISETQQALEQAAFESFVSAREQAGLPIKVSWIWSFEFPGSTL
jgi:F-box-like